MLKCFTHIMILIFQYIIEKHILLYCKHLNTMFAKKCIIYNNITKWYYFIIKLLYFLNITLLVNNIILNCLKLFKKLCRNGRRPALKIILFSEKHLINNIFDIILVVYLESIKMFGSQLGVLFVFIIHVSISLISTSCCIELLWVVRSNLVI